MENRSPVVEILAHRVADGTHEFDVRLEDGSTETRRAKQVSVDLEHRDADGELVSTQKGLLT